MTTEAPLHLYQLTGQERVKITQINPNTQLLSPENVFCTTADIATLAGGGGSSLEIIQGSDTVSSVETLTLTGSGLAALSGSGGSAILEFASAGPNIEIGFGSITATYTAGANISITNGSAGSPGTIALNPSGMNVDLFCYVPKVAGPLSSSQTIWEIDCVRALSFPANLTGSIVKLDVAATANTTLTLSQNGTARGTAVIPADGTVATLSASAITTTAGDLLAWTGQAIADATAAGIRIAMTGSRV